MITYYTGRLGRSVSFVKDRWASCLLTTVVTRHMRYIKLFIVDMFLGWAVLCSIRVTSVVKELKVCRII